MVEEDDDYMADLSRFVPTESPAPASHGRNGKPSTDIKDSLPRKDKRKVQQVQQKEAEDENRKDGLGSAIPSTNIGFKMLQQMGYTPGDALGKHGDGLLEPINIDRKRSRAGLGREGAAKEEEKATARLAELERTRTREKENALRADFQERSRDLWQCRKIISDYRKACATYLQLEESSSMPTVVKELSVSQQSPIVKEGLAAAGETEDAAEDEEEVITFEILQEMLQKLRSQYNYCLYCGCKYDSAEALFTDCPGMEDDAH